MSPLPSAAQGSKPRAAGDEPAARVQPRPTRALDPADAQELLVSLGFLLVPGPPFERGPAFLLVAVRPHPSRSHFDPERIVVWADATKGGEQMVLEWPMRPPPPNYSWGAIDVVDRLGEVSRFVSFGGVVSVARDRDVQAALFRSDAPILSVGGHSGPADPLSADVGAFFGILRAAGGSSERMRDLIRSCSPLALYAAFLTRYLAVNQATRRNGSRNCRVAALLRREMCRLERDAGADLLVGEQLAAAAAS